MSTFALLLLIRFTPVVTFTTISSCTTRLSLPRPLFAQEKDDNDKSMENAFRKLDALDSLDDEVSVDMPPPIESKDVETTKASPITTEQEVQLYTSMVQELESRDEDALYADVLEDMGGTKPETDNELYASVLEDMGANSPSLSELDLDEPAQEANIDKDRLLDDAISQALEQVTVNGPSTVDSILEDEDMMKEIEDMFEKGNEKLLASLQELRKEQMDLAKANAEQRLAQSEAKATQAQQERASRLALAEKSMQRNLDKVADESKAVQAAMDDLERAKEAADPFVALRSWPKQLSLVGTILFASRAVVADNPEGSVAQGVLAAVFAVVFFLV